jgi:phytoene synthase
LNIELARIRDVVNQPALGEIRLQWWLDAVNLTYSGGVPGHPVMEALAPAIEHGRLSFASFCNMIEARRFDLYDDPMPTLNALEGYLGETAAALIQMSALIIDRKRAEGCAEAAGLAGVAMGIPGLMRLLPMHRSRGQCFIPSEVLEKHGLTPGDLIAGRHHETLSAVLGEMQSFAWLRLEEARSKRPTIASQVYPAFLPVALAETYLHRLKSLGLASLHRTAEVSQLKRQWRLYWCARRRVF